MKSRFRMKRVWIAGLASVVVGAAFLLSWQLTRERLPAGAIVVPKDAPTLAAALERAAPGGVIVLDARSGPFAGSVSVNVPGITIRSREGRALLEGGEGVALTIAADDVTITGIAVEGTGIGVSVAGSNCRIAQIEFAFLAVAVRVVGGSGNVVEECALRDGTIGVDVLGSGTTLRSLSFRGMSDAAVRGRDASGCVFSELAVDSCSEGISLEDMFGARLTGVRVSHADVSIVLSGGSGAVVEGCILSTSRVGLELRDAEDSTMSRCRFDGMAEAGVALEGARRTRVTESTFRMCAEGVRASEARESALCDNTFADCSGAAIALHGGEDDLVSRNDVRGGETGIVLEGGSEAQLLRNSVEDALLVGILIDRANGVQILDAGVAGCATGIAAVATSDVTIHRCDVSGAADAGILFLNGTSGNMAIENHILDSGEGLLVVGSSRDAVTENVIERCGVGIGLRRLGVGVRVEGNDVRRCKVGLAWTDAGWADEAPLARLGFGIDRAVSIAAPLVSDNVFGGSRIADVRNETETALLVGGNRWPDGAVRVEGSVSVPESGQRGTIGLGAASSTSDLVLGQLLQWMLLEEGLRVVDLIGLSSDDRIERAFVEGDLDAAWCTEGVARASGGSFWRAPVERGWSVVTTAKILAGAGKEPARVTVAVPSGVPHEAVAAALATRGLDVRATETVGTGAEAESLLKFGTVDCAVVERLEETATLAGFVALDDVSIAPDQALGLCVRGAESEAALVLRAAFDRLSARLSEESLRNLVSRVRLLRRDPADVAMEYLLREGLIGGSAEGGAR